MWVLVRKMFKFKQVLTSVVKFHYHIANWNKGRSMVSRKKAYTKGQLKLTHIEFAILNSHVTGKYLRLIRKHFFLFQYNKKMKITISALFKSDNC